MRRIGNLSPACLLVTAGSILAIGCSPAHAQLRVAAWNISNYAGGRDADLKNALYASFSGRQLAPDIIVTQEFLSTSAVSASLAILNSAPGSPADWAAVSFTDGPDTDSACFYRTSKITFLNTSGTGHGVIAVPAQGTAGPPRNVMRYDVRPVGYSADEAVLAIYSVHMKSGTSSDDQNRRRIEAEDIRENMETLPLAWNFVIGGDFNIQSSSQQAYQTLLSASPSTRTQYIDPISTPGSWNNSSSFRFVHTQDPVGSGGMDDRHDQLLMSERLFDGEGLEYIGNQSVPYSTSTWNDPNHSYRCWGNDGTSFDAALTVTNNQMVGATIAQSLKNAANGAGHLPVFLDLRVPAEIDSTEILDFGEVPLAASAMLDVGVWNAGDTALWTASGIADLNYSLSASSGFSAPAGSFIDAPSGTTNSHTISMDTSTPGVKVGTLIIASDAPDEPERVVTLMGEVIDCRPDFNNDATLDAFDYDDFVSAYFDYVNNANGFPDYNNDGYVDAFDYDDFVSDFFTGC